MKTKTKSKVKIVFILVLVVAAAVYALINFGITETYTAPEAAPVVEEVAAPVDSVLEAQKQLDEAKYLLNTEEAKILSEIDEKEARLEEIRAVRLSFSQAPGQLQ